MGEGWRFGLEFISIGVVLGMKIKSVMYEARSAFSDLESDSSITSCKILYLSKQNIYLGKERKCQFVGISKSFLQFEAVKILFCSCCFFSYLTL